MGLSDFFPGNAGATESGLFSIAVVAFPIVVAAVFTGRPLRLAFADPAKLLFATGSGEGPGGTLSGKA